MGDKTRASKAGRPLTRQRANRNYLRDGGTAPCPVEAGAVLGTSKHVLHRAQRTFFPRTFAGTWSTARQVSLGHMMVTVGSAIVVSAAEVAEVQYTLSVTMLSVHAADGSN